MQPSETSKQPASAEQELNCENKQTTPATEIEATSKSASSSLPSEIVFPGSVHLVTSAAPVKLEQHKYTATIAEPSENGSVSNSTTASFPANASASAKSSCFKKTSCYSRSDDCSSANDDPHHQHHPPVAQQTQQIAMAFDWLTAVGSWALTVHRHDSTAVRLMIDEDDVEYVLDPNAIRGVGYDFTQVPRGYE